MSLKGRNGFTGALKGVSCAEYESLKLAASHVHQMETERDRAISRIRAAEKQAAEAQEIAKQAQNEKPLVMVTIENANLKARIGRVEKWLKILLKCCRSV